ncbi:hypothetical protein DCAR_0624296 [Daucus carota subsp. sativus]|uniref:Transferase, Chloramphenicol acetyltransferase-like domain protein n=1 Tax=Daucus carota subsp. sativus TaxID=79200 RepID=A0AAF0XDC7_DAUCS|nr:hypothetical protein DCAR_0624296 [Daucus carota subsp. sativus]
MMIRRLISKRQLHVVSRSKTNIKPASPTPLQLKHYHLPFHDRMMSDVYNPIIFFYPNPQPLAENTTISNLLKKSLSKTLSKYYPFAGRLSPSGSHVECNDEGVQFFEAQISCKLSEMLRKPPVREEEEGFGHLFPRDSIWRHMIYSLMFVQLSQFSCGGIAIAVGLSHRVADATTLFSFLLYWANLSCTSNFENGLIHLQPCFVNKLLPGSCHNNFVPNFSLYPQKHWITKEIVFPNSKIAELKAKLQMNDKLEGVIRDRSYTRTELLTALLYRCAGLAAVASNSGDYPKSVMLQTVNMRPLLDPPLPKTSVGNLFTYNHIPTSTTSELQLSPLVGRMKNGLMQLRGVESLEGKEIMVLIEKYAKSGHRKYIMSSICNMPLYEGMDFGWGRPVRANVVDAPFVNCMYLTDSPGKDGITATVSLEEQDMKNFLLDKELLTYACL